MKNYIYAYNVLNLNFILTYNYFLKNSTADQAYIIKISHKKCYDNLLILLLIDIIKYK